MFFYKNWESLCKYLQECGVHTCTAAESLSARFSHLVDMVVDYSQHIMQDYRYISDAGYCWNIITEPETNDLLPDVKNVRIGSFDNLKKEIDKGVSLVISTHPHRWESSAARIYARIYFFKVVRAVVRVLRNVPGVETLLNKFYFLAKKI
ncbi:MAG: hypothetical protein HUK11_05175 [Muribaculaceae bacterium]|nr:hypothetical protein [Muribaculaceae bacterium]